MQLGLIVGIAFAIGAVIFAMQNIAPVTVTLGFRSFEGSLALVLPVALGLGALIAGLISSPAMIRRQWNVAQLGRQVAELETRRAADAAGVRAGDAAAAGVAAVSGRSGAGGTAPARPSHRQRRVNYDRRPRSRRLLGCFPR